MGLFSFLNRDTAVRPATSAIHRDITFSKEGVYVWVSIPLRHFEVVTREEKELLVFNMNDAISSLLKSSEESLECHLISTFTPFDTEEWHSNYTKRATQNKAPAEFAAHADAMKGRLESLEPRQKVVLLGVKLGIRQDYGPAGRTTNSSTLNRVINLLTGEEDEHISTEEITFWDREASLIRRALHQSEIEATPVSSHELMHLLQRKMHPAMPPPHAGDIAKINTTSWGQGEISTLVSGTIKNHPKYLEIIQYENGIERKGYQATLCFAKFPDVLDYPNMPWIKLLDSFDTSYEFSSRFSVVPAAVVRKEVGNKRKVIDDAEQDEGRAGTSNLDTQIRKNMGEMLEYQLANNETPWIYGRHRVTFTAENPDELAETIEDAVNRYKSAGIVVVWTSGDQLDLFLESFPSDKVRIPSYYQRHALDIIGAGVANGDDSVGDRIITDPSTGQKKGWLDSYVGYTTLGSVNPTFLSVHSAISKNLPPTLTVTGSPGSGKSNFGLYMTVNSVLSGVKTVYIDPKMDALPLQFMPGLEDSSVFFLKDAEDGVLDPFLMGSDKTERLELAQDTIFMLLGGGHQLTPNQKSALYQAIKVVSEERFASMNKLTDILLASQDKEAKALGESLSIIRQLPFARLCFSSSSVHKAPPSPPSLDKRLNIISLFGLDLPPAGLELSTYTTRNHLALTVMFLVTSFTRSLMLKGDYQNNPVPKAIFIDEAWAVTSTEQGKRLITEVAKLGRSLNVALTLLSQNVADFMGESITNNVSIKVAFRATAKEEIEKVLDYMDITYEEEYYRMIQSLSTGECLMKDAEGHVSRVQIDNWNKLLNDTITTNPEAKRLKAELEASADRNI